MTQRQRILAAIYAFDAIILAVSVAFALR